jgi:hypothetical protein
MRVWLTFAALIFLAIMVTGCASVPEKYWEINRATSHKFTYISDIEKHGVHHFVEYGTTGNSRFTGDCEEYALAIQYQLATIGVNSVIWVTKRRAGLHALTCSDDGWCFDAFTVPERRESVQDVFITRM